MRLLLLTAVADTTADYATDPLLKRWRKLGVAVEGTQRDPSSALRMDSGERRFRTVDAVFFGASSDKRFGAARLYRIGQSNLPVGECPSIYALPNKSSPGFEEQYERLLKAQALPTHVFKNGARPTDPLFNGTGRGGDAYSLGNLPLDPKLRQVANATFATEPRREDSGKYYASKDVEMPGGRRWNMGWAQHVAVGGSGPQALPREVTYNAALKQLQWAPPVETERLREAVLFNNTVKLSAEGTYLRLPRGAGAQAEVIVRLLLPARGARFSLQVGCEQGGINCTDVYVEGGATADAVTVGVLPAAQSTVSDIKPQATTLRLAPGESHVELRVFVDHFIGEAFFQGGREAFTFDVRQSAQMRLRSSGGVSVGATASATAWALGSILVSKEQVLATPRIDGPLLKTDYNEGASSAPSPHSTWPLLLAAATGSAVALMLMAFRRVISPSSKRPSSATSRAARTTRSTSRSCCRPT